MGLMQAPLDENYRSAVATVDDILNDVQGSEEQHARRTPKLDQKKTVL